MTQENNSKQFLIFNRIDTTKQAFEAIKVSN